MAELNKLTINGSNYTFEDDVARGLATAEANRAQKAEQSLQTAINNKVDKVTGKGLSTNDYTNDEKAKLAGLNNYDDTQVRQLIAQTNANFANYYTKAESYSATEVDTLLRTQRQGQFVVVNTLPTPSADTMFKIYLVPSTNPETQNVKDEFVTLENNGTYSWEQIGSTAVDLSGYSTTVEMNAAIANALASYYTKSEIDTALGTKQNIINDLPDIRSGAQAGSTAVQPSTLNSVVKNTVAESGVYDVSANNDNTKFESLSALLGSANLNTLIPTDIRKGGMSIKFVQSSDNKYVQYMYNGTSTSVADFINLANWEKINLESDVKVLYQDVIGKYDYSFYAATGEHVSTSDLFPIDYKAGTIIKGKISLGTANWNGASLSALLRTDSGIVRYLPITMGQEFEISSTVDAQYISFYIYNITSAGSFIVNLDYGGIEKKIEKIEEIEEKQTTIVNDLGVLRYTFSANGPEHSSTLDKMPVRFHKGDIFKGKISLGTAAFNGADLRAYFFNSEGVQVTNKVVTMGEEFSLRLNSDVSYLSFYIYKIITGGTFNVEVIQEVANSVSVLQENFEGEKTILDFSAATVGATYVGRSFVLAKQIATNKAFSLYISTNDSSNLYYFNFYDSAGTRIGNYIRVGCGSRKIELTNTYGDAINRVDLVVIKIISQTIYNVSLLIDGESDLDIELDELGKNVSWLPNYLSVPGRYKSMLSTKESSIRDAMLEAGDNGSTFVFITDVHWPDNSKHSPALINYILQHLPIEDVFFGGDVINGGDAATQASLMSDFGQKMHKVAKRFFPVEGNHDFGYNDGGTGFDGDYFYTLLLKYTDYQIVSGEYNNFYYDNDRTKTRYIALNTGTNGDYHTSEQASWLSGLLNEMPLGYHAIIFLHVAYMTASNLENNIMTATMAAAVSVADTFNGQNNGKKVEAFICGHLHNDANKTTTGGIPIILTDCDSRQTSSGNAAAVDTIGEQAFDVITVNYSSTITCTRIGRGDDRVITY